MATNNAIPMPNPAPTTVDNTSSLLALEFHVLNQHYININCRDLQTEARKNGLPSGSKPMKTYYSPAFPT